MSAPIIPPKGDAKLQKHQSNIPLWGIIGGVGGIIHKMAVYHRELYKDRFTKTSAPCRRSPYTAWSSDSTLP